MKTGLALIADWCTSPDTYPPSDSQEAPC